MTMQEADELAKTKGYGIYWDQYLHGQNNKFRCIKNGESEPHLTAHNLDHIIAFLNSL